MSQHTPACEFDQAHGYECTCGKVEPVAIAKARVFVIEERFAEQKSGPWSTWSPKSGSCVRLTEHVLAHHGEPREEIEDWDEHHNIETVWVQSRSVAYVRRELLSEYVEAAARVCEADDSSTGRDLAARIRGLGPSIVPIPRKVEATDYSVCTLCDGAGRIRQVGASEDMECGKCEGTGEAKRSSAAGRLDGIEQQQKPTSPEGSVRPSSSDVEHRGQPGETGITLSFWDVLAAIEAPLRYALEAARSRDDEFTEVAALRALNLCETFANAKPNQQEASP